jgi:hypothetical protein
LALLRVQYHAVLRAPETIAESVQKFVGRELEVQSMVRQVDGSLYRQRRHGAENG